MHLPLIAACALRPPCRRLAGASGACAGGASAHAPAAAVLCDGAAALHAQLQRHAGADPAPPPHKVSPLLFAAVGLEGVPHIAKIKACNEGRQREEGAQVHKQTDCQVGQVAGRMVRRQLAGQVSSGASQ